MPANATSRALPGLKEVKLPLSTLQRLRKLYFICCSDLKLVKINMGNEEKQGFSGGHISNSNFLNLVHVQIAGCHGLLNLTWLIYAPSLEGLMVTGGNRMEEIYCFFDKYAIPHRFDVGFASFF